eukprot:CAMPEP_0175181406 /NCGR_PEP_ID=MMETSP0087-20121206/36627_1 /TAXON_ID=136419 /ORGANISM="Unknown Unknown, Strain D1" /LENGTH=386 /DNA_ID=CAMNT_0016473897 /DNA_START=275 /DNA_END=1432 /DNA_ORIENTATION=+
MYNVPAAGGAEVPGARCTSDSLGTVMQFSRPLSAMRNQLAIKTDGSATWLIAAYGSSGTRTVSYHKQRGAASITFKKPVARPTVQSRPTTARAPSGNFRPTVALAPSVNTRPTVAAGPSASSPGIRLIPGLSFEYSFVGNDVLITVHGPPNTWVGIGVSPNGKMAGSDVVVCSGGRVKRHFVTGYNVPTSGGVDVAAASCQSTSSGTVMRFTRAVNADASGRQRTVNTGGSATWLIAAFGASGSTVVGYHKQRGAEAVVFRGGPAVRPSVRPRPTAVSHPSARPRPTAAARPTAATRPTVRPSTRQTVRPSARLRPTAAARPTVRPSTKAQLADGNEKCKDWGLYCETNEYVGSNCKKTCSSDADDKCSSWGAYCKSNDYVKAKCR